MQSVDDPARFSRLMERRDCAETAAKLYHQGTKYTKKDCKKK